MMQTTLQLPRNVGPAFRSRARQHSLLYTLNPCPAPTVPHRNHNVAISATVKIKDYGNAGNFEIPDEQKALLEQMLSSPSFCEQVGVNAGLPADKVNRVEFTGLLFQPVPWSPSTKKGMPQELEQYFGSDQHVIINVPPTAMFKAKVFNPSRLCAVYEVL